MFLEVSGGEDRSSAGEDAVRQEGPYLLLRSCFTSISYISCGGDNKRQHPAQCLTPCKNGHRNQDVKRAFHLSNAKGVETSENTS